MHRLRSWLCLHRSRCCREGAKLAGELALLRDLVEAGKLAAHVAKVLPLASIREALDLSEEGHTRGKIVLRIAA